MNILFEFEKFPLSVCTQQGDLSSKEKLVKSTIEEDEQGLITFLPFVDPKEIYLEQHNSSIGKTWKEHNNQFAEYVFSYEKEKIIDVGGGSGNIYKSYIQYNNNVKWKIIDLNPTLENPEVELIKGFYNSTYIHEGETVITSHFLEHLTDLKGFLTDLRKRNPKQHIFSLPNFKQYAKNNYSATLMFEHPYYLTEDYLDYILAVTGWKIVNKQYYKDHSIFFSTIPTTPVETKIKLDYKEDINNFLQYMQNRANEIKNIPNFYVFGAHYTYYYLINMGISVNQITAVVDNDPNKQGRRMYGTNTKVISPQELEEEANVFVEMGPYNKEIIKELNNVKNKINYI